MKDALIITALSVVPKHPTSRLLGWLNGQHWPRWMHRILLRWYIGHYKVNLDECVGGIEDYPSLAEFFVRPLKPGMRPIAPDPDGVVSPVDARVYRVGDLDDGQLTQAEGQRFGVTDLLGEAGFTGGSYAILYLSPRDYHRIHTPREGTVVRTRYQPGQLWPVFPAATRKISALFAINERMTSIIDTPSGPYALVMVGAFGVGRMRVVFADLLSNQGRPAEDRALSVPVARGDEFGRFEMGSTVILVFPKKIQWLIRPDEPVRVGQLIAKV